MSRFFGDSGKSSARPSSAGGTTRPFGSSSSKASTRPPARPHTANVESSSYTSSLLPAITPQHASRKLAQHGSPRSIGSSSALASESSWSSIGSVLSSAPTTASLSSSPPTSGPTIPDQSTSPKRVLVGVKERVPPPRLATQSNKVSAPPESAVDVTTSSNATHQQQTLFTSKQKKREDRLPSFFGSHPPTANDLKDFFRSSSESGESNRMKTGIELTRSSSEPEPVTTPSSHYIADDALQHLPTEVNLCLPYNQTITLQQQEHQIKSKTRSDESAKYDYTGIIGYQAGDPTSKDRFTFFKRKNIHTALQPPFSPDQVPYVDGYDNETLDFRYVRFMATKHEIDMLPWSKRREFDGFKPGKVLDVGCEISAPWILDASQIWTETHFVGMDVAPVLVPKHRLPPDLASRLTFVQANFLEAWPFEDESFDFVRIGFAGVAVPEHMWGHIFEEAARVCKPITGIIQCIDDLPVINYPVPAMGEAPGGIVHAQEGKVMLEKGSETTLGIVSSSSVETKESIVNTEENEDIIQAKAKAFEIALESLNAAATARLLPLYRISIFPAAMVLTCTGIVGKGPTRIQMKDCGGENAVLTAEEAEKDIEARLYIHAATEAFAKWGNVYQDATIDVTGDNTDLRSQAQVEKSWKIMGDTIRQKADISSLLAEKFDWTCETDEIMAEALGKQIVAIEAEKQQLLAKQASSRDDFKMTEVDRALRDVKADLAATQRRMGHITGGISGMSGTAKTTREFKSPRDLEGMVLGLDLVMKAGRKAA